MPDDHEDDPVDAGRDLGGQSAAGPPHPFDRVWVHPSELPAGAPLRAPRRPRRPPRPPTLVALVLGAAGGAAVALAALVAADAVGDGDPVTEPPRAVFATAEQDDPLETVVDRVADSLVHVRSVTPDGGRAGSGVCIRHRGEVLTADALVANAQAVVVVERDGREHAARIVGRDADSGLALLRVDAPLHAAVLSEEEPEAGDAVHAVGARPGHAMPWVSAGIISATRVRVAGDDGRALKGGLATDVRPGAAGSGGALVDQTGAVVGILIAPVDGDPTTYAVPTALAIDIAEQLRANGSVAHGWLGVQGRDGIEGVTVVEVVRGGPAARAGLRAGDVVRGVGGVPVARMVDLIAEVRWATPETWIVLDVLRDGDAETVRVLVGDAAEGAADAVAPSRVPAE
jgi:S1-C subfamily serine protease